MDPLAVGTGKRVRIYVGEHDHAPGGKQPVWEAILQYLRREGAAGATMFRGLAGFGAHSRLHTARFADVVPDLPVVIEWIDGPERVERLLPRVCQLVPSGTITLEDVEIAKYTHRAPHALPPDTVGQVMTREEAVVAVQPGTPLGEVVRLLLDRDLRSVPVVDAEQRLVGIVTNRDLVERGGLSGRVELLATLRGAALEHELAGSGARQKTVADVMTRGVASTRPEASLESAVHLMVERQIKRLPVVDAAGRLVGVLSRVDVLRTMGEDYHRPDPETARASGPGQPGRPGRPVERVGDLMRTDVPTVAAGAPLGEVLDAVTSTRLNRAIVVDAQRRVQGIVSDADLLARLDPGGETGVLGALMGRSQPLGHRRVDVVARDLIRGQPVVAPADLSVGEAVRRMLESRRKVLPIIDAEGRLLGAVDRADLLAHLRAAGG